MKNKVNKGIVITGGQINANNLIIGNKNYISNANEVKKALHGVKERVTDTKLTNQDLKELLSKNKVQHVIEYLTGYFKENAKVEKYNTITLISARFEKVNKAVINGLISIQDSSVEVLRIINSLLDLIDRR